MKNGITLLLSLIVTCANCLAQESTLHFMNGKKLQVTKLSYADNILSYAYRDKKGNTKLGEINDALVFSSLSEEKETVYYQPDLEENPESYTVDEMRNYIDGISFANTGYKPKKDILIGLAAGFAAGFGSGSSLISIAAVPTIALGIGIFPISTKKLDLNKNPLNSPYTNGYIKQNRNKRFIHTICSAALGATIGVVSSNIAFR